MTIIKIKSGYSNFNGGLTKVELNTTGEINIENEYKGKKQQINKQISVNEKLEKIISGLEPMIRNWEFNIRKGVPDEVFYDIEIINLERKDANLKFGIWHNDLKLNPLIGEMIKYMKDLVKQVSNQKVVL